MTCKDCIHRELCADYVSSLAKVQNADVKYISQWLDEIEGKKNQTDNECEHFADCSRFVELPCKLGDLVYFIKARRVMADIVSKFTIDKCGVTLQRVNGYNLGYTDQLGKRIFLTHEEAEQALKEREKR